MTSIRYIGVDFTFGLLNCVRYDKDFVISRFVISRFRFHTLLFNSSFGRAEGHRSLDRRLCYIEAH